MSQTPVDTEHVLHSSTVVSEVVVKKDATTWHGERIMLVSMPNRFPTNLMMPLMLRRDLAPHAYIKQRNYTLDALKTVVADSVVVR